ncbi:DUF3558 domain-containing protein [Nocardia sp. NPDC058666]|uniref:DUF3558 domain-containing protein n=1 Tax=Nocardia sp. NPDC058666 TaxID=3346587 RepID=UPI003657A1E6
MKAKLAIGIPLFAIAISACTGQPSGNNPISTGDSTAPATSARPSILVAVPAAPPQVGRAGTRAGYDPCFEIGDGPVSELGFEASSRVRSDFIYDDYAWIGCKFERREKSRVTGNDIPGGWMIISSTDLSLDKFWQRSDFSSKQAITVNGREALSYMPEFKDRCSIAMKGPDGVISVDLHNAKGLSDWDGCDHIQEAAEKIESALPRMK